MYDVVDLHCTLGISYVAIMINGVGFIKKIRLIHSMVILGLLNYLNNSISW